MIERRTVLAALASCVALRSVGTRASVPDPIGVALDEASRLDPSAALRRLADIDVDQLQPGRRLDVITARAGLAIDDALTRAPNNYTLRIARTLGTVSAETAEARLDRALVSLLGRADRVFASIGMRQGNIGARFAALFADQRYHYRDSPIARDAAVSDMNHALAEMRVHAMHHIVAPAFCFDAAARQLTAAEIADGKGGFREAPAPGRPGVYVVDLKDIHRRPRWSLPSVVAHELVPGHMIQLGIEQVQPPHPLRMTYASAFVEGWAIHAETLADQWGAFAQPRSLLGHLHWLIFRAARGKIDIAIHRHGWSTEQGLAALANWMGVPVYFAPFETDVMRIANDPGNRAAEAMAWLSIADHAPDGSFERRAFYQSLLADGRRRIENFY